MNSSGVYVRPSASNVTFTIEDVPDRGEFVVYATQNVEVAACAVVAPQDELPPPPPEPWTPGPEEDAPP